MLEGDARSLLSILGSIFGILAPLVLAVVGFLIRSWIAEARRSAEEREQRMLEKVSQTNADLVKLERDHHRRVEAIAELFNTLPDKYIPRKEMEAVISRIEQGNETMLTYLRKVDSQVDRLTRLILTGHQEKS